MDFLKCVRVNFSNGFQGREKGFYMSPNILTVGNYKQQRFLIMRANHSYTFSFPFIKKKALHDP